VVAVGAGKVLDNGEQRPLTVQVGDTIVFGQYAGSNTIEVNGEELILMSEGEIYAVID
jgi:chaperonin GroES